MPVTFGDLKLQISKTRFQSSTHTSSQEATSGVEAGQILTPEQTPEICVYGEVKKPWLRKQLSESLSGACPVSPKDEFWEAVLWLISNLFISFAHQN